MTGNGAYQHIRKARPRVTARVEWMRAWPRRGRNVRFWSEVARRVKARRVRHKDLDRVRAICEEVDEEIRRGRIFL